MVAVVAIVILGLDYHTVLLELELLKSQSVFVAFYVRKPQRMEQEFSILSLKASPVLRSSQEL